MRIGGLVVAVLVAGALYLFDSRPIERASESASMRPEAPLVSSDNFQCEGKTRCTQMASCAEATFYLRNCPGVQVDGDHDGVPCEDQLCGR